MKSAIPTDVHEHLMAVDMNVNQLLAVVQKLSNRAVTRPTLARWRKEWGFDEPPYKIDHARLLAHYGDLLKSGFSPEIAKKSTINYFEKELNHG